MFSVLTVLLQSFLWHSLLNSHPASGALIPHRHTLSSREYDNTSTPDVQAPNTVAVYFGQTEATGKTSLASMCQDPSVDVVLLGFLETYFGPGGFPSLNLGAACDGQTAEMQGQAPGLLSCPDLATQIQTCQSLGKKVLLSLGGWKAATKLGSDAQATELAATLWNLFGAGTSIGPGLRPFGTVRVDGFDFDNETNDPSYYATLTYALRAHFSTDPSKAYYISAAPQCPQPSTNPNIPSAALQNADFVFAQFYNNPSCDVGSAGFEASFAAWSAELAASTRRPPPKLFLGAAAFAGAGSGYVSHDRFASIVKRVKGRGYGNFGGVMLWDGSEGLFNVDSATGKNYLQVAKTALES